MVRGLSQRNIIMCKINGDLPVRKTELRALIWHHSNSTTWATWWWVKGLPPEYPSDFWEVLFWSMCKDHARVKTALTSLWYVCRQMTIPISGDFYNKGNETDHLGFDNRLRSLTGGIDKMNTDGKRSPWIRYSFNGLNKLDRKNKKLPARFETEYFPTAIWDTESGQYGLWLHPKL